jgi:hypothetical protein
LTTIIPAQAQKDPAWVEKCNRENTALLEAAFAGKQAMTKGRALEAVQSHLSSAAVYPDRAARHSLVPTRTSAGTRDRDRHGPVVVRCPACMIVLTRRGAHPLFVGDFAALRPVEEPRSVGPILYFKGVSTGDFEEALIALLGKDAGGLSATTAQGGLVAGACALEQRRSLHVQRL